MYFTKNEHEKEKDKMSIFTVCILGKRQSYEKNSFIESSKIFTKVLNKNGFYTQTRTLGWPSPHGLLDKVVTRVSDQLFIDLQIPKKYDILFLIDQYESISERDISIFLKRGGFFIRNSPRESIVAHGNFTNIYFNFNKLQHNNNPHILSYTIHKLFNLFFSSEKKDHLLDDTSYSSEREYKLEIDSFFEREFFDKIQEK